jgi:hypothetical protein
MQFDILLEAEVLRDFETVYRKSRSRNWFHPYLTEVFALALKLKSAGILEEMAETGYPLRPADASSQDDHRRDFEGRFQDSQPLGPSFASRVRGQGRMEPNHDPVEVF